MDFVLSWVMEKGCKALFADLKPAELVTRGESRRLKRRETEEADKEKAKLTNGHANGMPELKEIIKKNQ